MIYDIRSEWTLAEDGYRLIVNASTPWLVAKLIWGVDTKTLL